MTKVRNAFAALMMALTLALAALVLAPVSGADDPYYPPPPPPCVSWGFSFWGLSVYSSCNGYYGGYPGYYGGGYYPGYNYPYYYHGPYGGPAFGYPTPG